MNRAEQESTAPIRRDELQGLLDAMDQQPDVDSGERSRPKRRHAPFSQVAALLPASPELTRLPRATRPPPLRAKTPEQRAVRTLAEARARLDTADEMAAQWAASAERCSMPMLPPHVVAHLSREEIAMLPMELRLTLPDASNWETPPRIEMTPLPGDIEIRSTLCKQLGHSICITEHETSTGARSAIIAIFAALIVGWCAGYFVL